MPPTCSCGNGSGDMIDRLGPYELNQIYTGDARELARAIPGESVDLIFTDPVYDQIEDYEWLAETAARVLKPDRACLVWLKTSMIPDIIKILEGTFVYRWLFDIVMIGPPMLYGKLGVNVQRCLWVDKGEVQLREIIFDGTVLGSIVGQNRIDLLKESSTGWAKRKNGANWSKDERALSRFVNSFTDENMIIFDPFTGLGSIPAVCKMLGRNYLAFEVDPATAELARERVRMTQPPLPIQIPEQLDLLSENAI